jgi:hypothetical protein
MDVITVSADQGQFSVRWDSPNDTTAVRYTAGQRLTVDDAADALDDTRFWTQALVNDLGEKPGHAFVRLSSQKTDRAVVAFTVKVAPTNTGPIRGYAFRCPDGKDRGCEVVGDKFDASEPLVRVPRLNAGDSLMFLVRLTAAQKPPAMRPEEVISLEVQ